MKPLHIIVVILHTMLKKESDSRTAIKKPNGLKN